MKTKIFLALFFLAFNTASYSATVTPEVAGGTQQSAVVISKTTTSFVVRVFSGTTALASTSATLNWSVQDY